MSGWLDFNKTTTPTGGQVTCSVASGGENTGRNVKKKYLRFSAANCEDVVTEVRLLGASEFASLTNSAVNVTKTGGNITLTGKSNSSKLTFSKGTDTIGVTLPANYTAGGQTTVNGAAISGDPGASGEYTWELPLTIPENTAISSKTCQIIVTTNGGTSYTCTITLAAGDAYLTVSPAYVELPADGSTSATFNVSTNTTFEVVETNPPA